MAAGCSWCFSSGLTCLTAPPEVDTTGEAAVLLGAAAQLDHHRRIMHLRTARTMVGSGRWPVRCSAKDVKDHFRSHLWCFSGEILPLYVVLKKAPKRQEFRPCSHAQLDMFRFSFCIRDEHSAGASDVSSWTFTVAKSKACELSLITSSSHY